MTCYNFLVQRAGKHGSSVACHRNKHVVCLAEDCKVLALSVFD